MLLDSLLFVPLETTIAAGGHDYYPNQQHSPSKEEKKDIVVTLTKF